ncbi:rhomboid family intramembrane serine protease [Pedobacter glucosidilyticus]|uniref:rhomboid family intramembrane serine protease n=1 Tax=Pedobacter glucosidilyticus TaxID=1122941 RepID=UPI0003FC753B|nr:rhomboid family intramembrane serine protease [Pedobacter glucosidilyticus]
MAWGISPKKTAQVPLHGFGTDKYLAIVFNAFENLNWKVSYADDKGLIAYTPISWESYSEQITVVIENEVAYLKSECVGYQAFLYDYGKNEKNIDLLITEIEYCAFHIQTDIEGNILRFKDSFYQHPGINLSYTPLGAKDKFTHLGTIFIPRKNYQVTPVLIAVNCLVFILQRIIFSAYVFSLNKKGVEDIPEKSAAFSKIVFGGIERNLVLNGEYWRLFTACFSHGSVNYIFFNMIFLAYIGSIIEGRVGKWNFLGLYLMTGICASITSIGFRYEEMGVGASGAIMGMFGVFLAYLSTNFFDTKARTAFLISTVLISIITLWPSGEGIDHAAHFGGFISGYIFGIFSYWAYTKAERTKRYFIRTVSYILILLAVSSWVFFMPKYDLEAFRKSKDKMMVDLNLISSYFYASDYDTLTKAERIVLLETKMIPVIRKNEIVLKELKNTPLPSEEEKDAKQFFKYYGNKLKIYELLYKEYKTDHPAYRTKMQQLTDEIYKQEEE